MKDPAHKEHVNFGHGLRREEIVRDELHPICQLSRLQLSPLLHRLRQILHDEMHMLGIARQELRDAPMPAPDIHHHDAGPIKSRPVKAREQMPQAPRFSLGEIPHAGAKAPPALGVPGQKPKDGQRRAIVEAVGCLMLLTRIAVGFERVDDSRRGRRHLVGFQAHGIVEVWVLDETAGESRVPDLTRRGFGKDMVLDGVSYEALSEEWGEAAGGGYGVVGRCARERNGVSELVVVDDA